MNSYITFSNNRILIGNNLIERAFELKDNVLCSLHLADKLNGKVWIGDGENIVLSQDFDYKNAVVSFDVRTVTDNSLTQQHLLGSICWETDDKAIVLEIRIYDDSPFISFIYKIKGSFDNKKTYMDKIGIQECELSVKAAQLNTATDYDCNTVVENSYMILGEKVLSGNVFVARDVSDNNAIVVVKDSPSLSDSIEPSDGTVELVRNSYIGVMVPHIADIERNSNEFCKLYGYTIGVGNGSDILTEYKRYYKKSIGGNI